MMMTVAAAAMVMVSCGKKAQTEGAEAGAEQTETTEQTETAADDASVAKAGENGYMAYDNKKGYTIDIPGGLFKYKNSILEEKDGEEGLLQYSLEKDNNMTNMMSVYFKEGDDMSAEAQKKEFEEYKNNRKDDTIVKEEQKDNTWTLLIEHKTEWGSTFQAIKFFYNPEKKVYADIEIEYNEEGKKVFTDEVVNHIFDSFKFK